MDDYLKGYADKYEKWQKEGDFTVSSQVVPIRQSLSAKQWVLPREQVMETLRHARSFSLTDCTCRTHYGRCDKPRDVCLLLDDLSEKALSHGKARRLSLDEADEVLKRAGENGLVHLTLYMPGHRIYAICSCCACCCHDLQLLRNHGRRDLVARSDYVAVTDISLCTDCGLCVEPCVFSAREMKDGALSYNPESCLGCGLCVPACPADATGMQRRKE